MTSQSNRLLGYVYTGPEWNHSEPNRTGFCLQGSTLEPVRNRSKRIQNWTTKKAGPVSDSFGSVPDRFQKWSRVNRRPLGFDFRTGSVWNRSRVNIGCVPLVESIKGFGVTDFSDLRFSMERQIQKRIYNHRNQDATLL